MNIYDSRRVFGQELEWAPARIDEGPLDAYVAATMSVLDIITFPDKLLRTECSPLEDVTDQTRHLFDDMIATMYDANGIGLAAIQVGIPNRVITVDITRDEETEVQDPLFLANPEIILRSDEVSTHEEGCLSIPGQFAEVQRPAEITVRYLDYHGKPREMAADGLMATVLQHEIDHLNGVLFIDHLSRLRRDVIIKKIAKADRTGDPAKERD